MAADFSIEFNPGGLEKLARTDVSKAMKQSLDAAGIYLQNKVRESITPFTRTGRLRSSITLQVTATTAVVGTNVNYAPPVEFGSRPHVIRARRAQALRWKSGGQVYFAKEVHHPGFKGHHFMEKTFERERQHVVDIFQRQLESWF